MQREKAGISTRMAPPYRFVRAPAEYPGPCYQPSGRVLEHHLVYWRHTGTLVPAGFVVHHKDDVGANNHFENLELLPCGEHTRLHHLLAEESLDLACTYCGVALTRTSRDVRSKNKQGQSRFFCTPSHAALARGVDLATETKHGTSSQYGKGCRCEPCRKYTSDRYYRRKVRNAGAIS